MTSFFFFFQVAFLSGWFPKTAKSSMEMKDAMALVAEFNATQPIDIFLSAQWPLGIEKAHFFIL